MTSRNMQSVQRMHLIYLLRRAKRHARVLMVTAMLAICFAIFLYDRMPILSLLFVFISGCAFASARWCKSAYDEWAQRISLRGQHDQGD